MFEQSLAPKYEKLAAAFAGEKDVVIAKVDATEEESLAEKYEVQGFPTLKFFKHGELDSESFDARELDEMVQAINARAGTQRNVDGTLLDAAGRVVALDQVVLGNTAAPQAVLESVKSVAAGLSADQKAAGDMYISIASKIVAKGYAYVPQEIARLESMINSASVSPLKKTNFMLRKNVLSAFVRV